MWVELLKIETLSTQGIFLIEFVQSLNSVLFIFGEGVFLIVIHITKQYYYSVSITESELRSFNVNTVILRTDKERSLIEYDCLKILMGLLHNSLDLILSNKSYK